MSPKTKQNIIKASNAVRWGNSPYKKYLGCAGKGGKTTNFFIKEGKKDA